MSMLHTFSCQSLYDTFPRRVRYSLRVPFKFLKSENNKNNINMAPKKRVCIIGAGTSGLCALKHALENDFEPTLFEQCKELGGTWVYNENVPVDAKDSEVYNSMYQGLRTNLPKEVMGFPDYLYPDNRPESFVASAEVLKFLQSYAENFKLKPYIKFEHEVIRVRPDHTEWEVYVRDKNTNEYTAYRYDFVFVCNGHYSVPQYPDNIPGMDTFKGKQLHSHVYRKPDAFKGERVLVIGAGPSGMDITNHVREVAEHVFLSNHLQPPPDTSFMPNVTQKTDLDRFTETGAIFRDGTTEEFSSVIYCTGYWYKFPFLSADCGITVDNNYVYPLYKHCINIAHPTMVLIGIPVNVCPTQLFDLQVRFALKFYTGEAKLPSSEEMTIDMEKDKAERFAKGQLMGHSMGDGHMDYYQQLSEIAGITNIKPVIGKIMKECGRKYLYELETYREQCFKVVDDENFIKYPL